MNQIEINVLLYPEGNVWVAQGLEFDITAEAASLPDVATRFATKVASEIAICLDLGREPLASIGPAPEHFWKLFRGARVSVSLDQPEAVRILDGPKAPRIIPRMKIAESAAA
jgi:hypothetical protein